MDVCGRLCLCRWFVKLVFAWILDRAALLQSLVRAAGAASDVIITMQCCMYVGARHAAFGPDLFTSVGFKVGTVAAVGSLYVELPLWCRAFQNSRSLAQQGAAVLLLSILKQGHLTDPATVAAVCAAAKKLAANEDICKELAEEGAVQITMQVHPHI